MSELKEPKPVKLFIAFLFAEPEVALKAQNMLEASYGPAEIESGIFEFNHTTYYNHEMGEKLRKKLVGFTAPVNPETLTEIKHHTHRLEKEFSPEGRRQVNLDPGYLNLNRVVLATGKDSAHRIYLRNGVYAEVTLVYQSGIFQPLPWTYPDYRAPEATDFFSRLRHKHKEQVR